MDSQEWLNELEHQLVEVKKRSEKADKKIDEIESIVVSLRNRLDKAQSQLCGGRQLRKMVWSPIVERHCFFEVKA